MIADTMPPYLCSIKPSCDCGLVQKNPCTELERHRHDVVTGTGFVLVRHARARTETRGHSRVARTSSSAPTLQQRHSITSFQVDGFFVSALIFYMMPLIKSAPAFGLIANLL